jgi:hypothetical protein
METLLMIGFVAAFTGLVTSVIVLYKLLSEKKEQRLEY